jgi:hypothetical protein
MSKWLAAYREIQWSEQTRVTGSTPYEITKKGCRVRWSSPAYGPCSGKLMMAPGEGWVLLQGEHEPDLLVWVREELLYATA